MADIDDVLDKINDVLDKTNDNKEKLAEIREEMDKPKSLQFLCYTCRGGNPSCMACGGDGMAPRGVIKPMSEGDAWV